MGQIEGRAGLKMTRYTGLEELQHEFELRKVAIRQRIADFAGVRPEEYFYELVYCLLTPQSSAANAGKAVAKLKAARLLDRDIEPAELLHQEDFYIRFHNTKGEYLKEAKRKLPEIKSTLCNGHEGAELREWLVKNVKGFGWKEASHFLRNIGYRDLAILDRHILKNLKRHNIIKSLPKTLTPKRYLAIEKKFRNFSSTIGITMDELDLLFWSHETGRILK